MGMTEQYVSIMWSYVTARDHEDNVWKESERNQCQDWSGCLISFGVQCIADWAFRPIQNQDCLSSSQAAPQLGLTQSHDAGKNSFILNRLNLI